MSGAAEPARPAPAPVRKARWKGLVKLALAAALLGYVFTTLPFSDRLEWRQAKDAPVHAVEGVILGEWKADAIRFELDAATVPDAAWPETLREGHAAGAPVAVTRGAAGVWPAWDWKPGMPRVFREVDGRWLLAGLLLFVVAVQGGVTRWWRLLKVVGCPTSWFNTLRLTFLGLFFNLVMPGLTGGDVVKAVIVVRENPGARAKALVSVAVDRIIGLLSLLALCAVVILASGDTFAEIRLAVLAVLAVGLGGALVYANGTLRRALRFDRLLAKLPFGEKLAVLDEAVLLYSRRPGELVLAVVFSLWNHVGAILGVWAIGHALGVPTREVGFGDWFAIVPVANIVASLPIAPGGWGIGEYAYKFLFEIIGATPTLGVAVSITFRLCQALLNLSGGLFLLAPGARVDLREVEEEAVGVG